MSWYEAIKDAVSAAGKLKSAELNEKMANVRMEGAKLAEENARLREELLELRKQQQQRESLKFLHSVYWREREGEADEGPFCPKCFDGSDRLARMKDDPGDDYFRCPVCKHRQRRFGR